MLVDGVAAVKKVGEKVYDKAVENVQPREAHEGQPRTVVPPAPVPTGQSMLLSPMTPLQHSSIVPEAQSVAYQPPGNPAQAPGSEMFAAKKPEESAATANGAVVIAEQKVEQLNRERVQADNLLATAYNMPAEKHLDLIEQAREHTSQRTA